jgi:hypothetical protein
VKKEKDGENYIMRSGQDHLCDLGLKRAAAVKQKELSKVKLYLQLSSASTSLVQEYGTIFFPTFSPHIAKKSADIKNK